MGTENLALFKGMSAKMDYLNHRQRVIAQNISNANTGGYKSMDLEQPDFTRALSVIERREGRRQHVSLVGTHAGHMGASGADVNMPGVRRDESTYEVSPDGNSVVLEEQMIRSQETAMDYNLMTSLYRKNVGMIMTSMGKQ